MVSLHLVAVGLPRTVIQRVANANTILLDQFQETRA